MVKKESSNFKKTMIILAVLVFIIIVFDVYIQLTGNNNLEKCSYLDPIIIDILAFFAAVFLIFEGIYKIYKNKSTKPINQLTRIFRIGLGFSILTLHIIQVLHK